MPGAAPLLGRQKKGPAIGARKGTFKPARVMLFTQALHLTAETKVHFAVNLRRLICLAAQVALLRRRPALDLLLKSAKLFAQHRSRPTAAHANLAYLWVEVQAKLKNRPAKQNAAATTGPKATEAQDDAEARSGRADSTGEAGAVSRIAPVKPGRCVTLA